MAAVVTLLSLTVTGVENGGLLKPRTGFGRGKVRVENTVVALVVVKRFFLTG